MISNTLGRIYRKVIRHWKAFADQAVDDPEHAMRHAKNVFLLGALLVAIGFAGAAFLPFAPVWFLMACVGWLGIVWAIALRLTARVIFWMING